MSKEDNELFQDAIAHIQPSIPQAQSNNDDVDNSYTLVQKSSASRYSVDTVVREDYTRLDYNGYRQKEADPKYLKDVMRACNDVYNDMGIVRNIIDLMSDFSCQGLTISHKDKSIENFYRNWFKMVNGYDIVERFLNYLYRVGNVVVYRTTAKIKKKEETQFKKATADYIDEHKIYRREIPWSYEFLNPINVDIEKVNGKKVVTLNVSSKYSNTSIDQSNNYLPDSISSQLSNGKRKIILDNEDVSTFHYKKDDWLIWAIPMIKPILKDLSMLEKMKLADLSALDGAISCVRLWTVGNLEHKIPPKPSTINKIRDIIASHVGGGTFDIVLGPEVTFKESNTQVYKFLGMEKYIPVYNNIYMGFGVSAAIAGSSGSNGGFNSNFVSIKTLVERLGYGRQVLTKFLQQEFEIVRKAMNFDEAAQVHFDSIILADEAAIKKLFIDLADRDLISTETLLERFNENAGIEKTRVERETKDRVKNPEGPQKVSPFHSPDTRNELAKLALNTGNLAPEYFEKMKLPFREAPVPKTTPSGGGGVSQRAKPKKQSNPQGGRPLNSKDTTNRKQRRVIPKSTASDSEYTNKLMWSLSAQEKISEIVSEKFLALANKKNVRSLSKEEFESLENIKLRILFSIDPNSEITEDSINKALSTNMELSPRFYDLLNKSIADFQKEFHRPPNIEEIRTFYSLIYTYNM